MSGFQSFILGECMNELKQAFTDWFTHLFRVSLLGIAFALLMSQEGLSCLGFLFFQVYLYMLDPCNLPLSHL